MDDKISDFMLIIISNEDMMGKTFSRKNLKWLTLREKKNRLPLFGVLWG